MKNLCKIFLVLTLFVFSALPTIAQTEIFAIGTENIQREVPFPEGSQRISPFLDSVLYSINPNTGQPTAIETIDGFTRCTGLDIHPITGQFFAVCDRNDINGEDPVLLTNNGIFITYLLILNPENAQVTEVGVLELPRGDFITDISFRSDGILFAIFNSLFDEDEEENTVNTLAANSLGIINTTNANITILGPTGVDDTFSAIGFTDTDTLLQCTDNQNLPGLVNTLNQTNGQATFLGNLGYPPEFDGFNIIASKDFDDAQGLFFATLFHEADRQDPSSVTNGLISGNFLITIDQDTGAVENIGPIALGFDQQFAALAVLAEPRPIAEVPTLSEYGLIATVVMLLGAAVLVLRRRQFKANI